MSVTVLQKDSCKMCVFGHEIDPKNAPGAMWCRKKSPVPLVVNQVNPITAQIEQGVQGFFSPTRLDWWCGEFEHKNKPRAEPQVTA